MRFLHLARAVGLGCLAALLLMVSPIEAATPEGLVVNPTRTIFVPSPDHNAVTEFGTEVVAGYKMRFRSANGQFAGTEVDLGKPQVTDLEADVVVQVQDLVALPLGSYRAELVAYGPGGESAAAVSNPFDSVKGAGAPRTVRVER